MLALPSKEQLQSYFFDGAWSLGLASLITGGIISPLTVIISTGLFGMQAAGGFPVTKTLSAIRERVGNFLDPDYQPDEECDEIEEDYDSEEDHEFKDDAPIHDGIRAQLFDTQVKSYLPARGVRKIPGMMWLLGEEAVRYTMPTLNPIEIINMPYGKTRSGKVNFKPVEKTESELTLKLR